MSRRPDPDSVWSMRFRPLLFLVPLALMCTAAPAADLSGQAGAERYKALLS